MVKILNHKLRVSYLIKSINIQSLGY